MAFKGGARPGLASHEVPNRPGGAESLKQHGLPHLASETPRTICVNRDGSCTAYVIIRDDNLTRGLEVNYGFSILLHSQPRPNIPSLVPVLGQIQYRAVSNSCGCTGLWIIAQLAHVELVGVEGARYKAGRAAGANDGIGRGGAAQQCAC